MERNTEKTITYTFVYSDETTVRYFVEVDGKDYEIVFKDGEIRMNIEETVIVNINKLPEVTITSSDSNIVEVNKIEDGGIVLTSKDGGTETIKVTSGNKSKTCIVKVDLFVGINKNETNPEGAMPSGNVTIIEADASKGIVIKDKNNRE